MEVWKTVIMEHDDGSKTVSIDPFKKHVCKRLEFIEGKLGGQAKDYWAIRRSKAVHELQKVLDWEAGDTIPINRQTVQQIIDWLTKP